MKLCVTGDREWKDYSTIEHHLLQYWVQGYTVLIEGDCRGADRIAGWIGKRIGYTVIPFPADWTKYGKPAGMIRNRQMLDEHPDFILGFHLDIAHSSGTRDCLTEAQRRGIPTQLITTLYTEADF